MKTKSKIIFIIFFVFCISFKSYSQYITEGFEGGSLPAGWSTTTPAWTVYNDAAHAHNGTFAAKGGYSNYSDVYWLITPQITVSSGDIFAFYVRAWAGTEDFSVKLSTTGNSTSNFTTNLATVTGVGTTYTRYEYNLSAYAGQHIYLAIKWTANTYSILFDDFTIGQIAPSINLPQTFSFIQGNPLAINFLQYIQTMNNDAATLSVTGNTNINVNISGLNVTFTSPNWSGTEALTFNLNDGYGKAIASDNVDVTVYSQPVDDIGIVSVQNPKDYTYLNYNSNAAVKVKNYGTQPLTNDIQVKCQIYDSINNEVYNQTQTYSADIAVNDSAEINFSSPWYPTYKGVFNVIFTAIYSGDSNSTNDTLITSTQVVEHFGIGGPDNMGYKWIDNIVSGGPVYNWIEISTTGQSAVTYEPGVTFSGDDNFSSPIPFGFSFPFYGIIRDSFYVDINGEILLADNVWYKAYPRNAWGSDGNMFNFSYPLPGYELMPALVAVYWDDLVAEQGTGDVYFQTFGTAPNRYCVIEWHNLTYSAGTTDADALTFEAIFYESGEMNFQYKDVNIGQTGSNAPHDNGRSSTIGIQNDDATSGLSYLREIVNGYTYIGVEPFGNLIYDSLAIKFYNDVDIYPPHFVMDVEKGNTFEHNNSLSVQITDFNQIASDTLYYNIGSGWVGISHSNINSNIYTYQLPEMPNSTTINYYFAATDIYDNRALFPENAPDTFYTFKILPTDNVDLLLLTPGTTPGYQDYNKVEYNKYVQALNTLGVNYDIYNFAEYPAFRLPENYRILFAYSNSFASGYDYTDTLCVALMDFLKLGTTENPKNIFFASDGLADGCYGHANSSHLAQFSQAFLRTGMVAQVNYPDFGGTDGIGGPNLNGFYDGSIIGTTSPLGFDAIEIPVYADSPDNLYYGDCPEWFDTLVPNPTISSYPAFFFQDGPINGNAYSKPNPCGVWLDNLTYKSFLLSFDISQFTNDNDIKTIIENALNWFGVDTTSIENINNYDFSVSAYPNPFSSYVNIKYNITERSNIKIEICNFNGQAIKILESGSKDKGNYVISWNPSEYSNLAQGVYFMKFSINNFSMMYKLVYIK